MEFSFDLCHGCLDTDTPEKKEMPKPIKEIKEIKEPIKVQPLSEPIDIPETKD